MWRAQMRLAPFLALFTIHFFLQRTQVYWEWEVLEGIFWCKDAFLCNICLTTTTINSKWLHHITINNKDCLFKMFNSQQTKYTKRLRAKTTNWTRVTVNRPPKTTNNLRRRGYHKVPKNICQQLSLSLSVQIKWMMNMILFFCQISCDSPSSSGNTKTSALLASKELHERLQKQGFCYFKQQPLHSPKFCLWPNLQNW